MPDYVMEEPVQANPEQPLPENEGTNAQEEQEEPETPSAKAEEVTEEEIPDLPDDVLEALAEVYADKFTEHPRIKEKIDREIQRRAEEKEKELRLVQERQARTQQALEEGKLAAQQLSNVLTAYQEAIRKIKSEDLDPSDLDERSLPSMESLTEALASFGTAVYVDAAATYDSAFSASWGELAKGLIREEDLPKVQEIASKAQQMEQNPQQVLQAKAYLFTESIKLLLERAREQGREEGRQEAIRKRDAIAKVTQANALNAALARLASKKMPPQPTPTVPANAPVVDYMKEYEQAKASGNIARAEEILSLWAQARARGEAT